ncbi:MAG: M55 family metallopeptidase, partial [Fidelibacterota bacterium]
SGHPASMVQELDDSFDALIFIGYHSRAGCGGNPLAHTMSSSKVERLWINDRETSEFLLFGYWAAALKVPIALVTGDEALTREVQELNPRISTVAVKTGFGDSTVNLHPAEAREQIQVAAQAAVSGNLKDCLLELPSTFKLRLRFVNQKDAYRASYFPRCELIDDKTISFNTKSYFEVLRLVLFVI